MSLYFSETWNDNLYFYDENLNDNFTVLVPLQQEQLHDYAQRLTDLGYDESMIRMALGYHFNWDVAEEGRLFEDFPNARLRFIELMEMESPSRTDFAFTKRIAKGTGLSDEDAGRWLERYRQEVEVARRTNKP